LTRCLPWGYNFAPTATATVVVLPVFPHSEAATHASQATHDQSHLHPPGRCTTQPHSILAVTAVWFCVNLCTPGGGLQPPANTCAKRPVKHCPWCVWWAAVHQSTQQPSHACASLHSVVMLCLMVTRIACASLHSVAMLSLVVMALQTALMQQLAEQCLRWAHTTLPPALIRQHRWAHGPVSELRGACLPRDAGGLVAADDPRLSHREGGEGQLHETLLHRAAGGLVARDDDLVHLACLQPGRRQAAAAHQPQ